MIVAAIGLLARPLVDAMTMRNSAIQFEALSMKYDVWRGSSSVRIRRKAVVTSPSR
jgi:hypothetical protein